MEALIKSVLLAGLMIAMTTEAKAVTTALGKPVEAIGSNVQAVPSCGSGACYNTVTGSIGFYIPLNSADNGTYGIDIPGPAGEAGTFSDSKSGAFANNNALTMYLRFTPLAPFPLASAVLTFSFVDLDLIGVNDPAGFTETIQFFSWSASLVFLPWLPSGPWLSCASDGSCRSFQPRSFLFVFFYRLFPFFTSTIF